MRLLEDRAQELWEHYGVSWRITGVASRRMGWMVESSGFDPAALLASDSLSSISRAGAPAPYNPPNNVSDWLAATHADVLFEATSLNVQDGQPAVDHIHAALEYGAHAITANKGPIVHAYRELRDLAAARGKRFLFESTVMDGVPIFSLFDQLPAIHLQGFHGILNSTTNVILGEMEQGLSFDAALKKAQELGVAETDATHDIDGWDAAVKTAALITVLMEVPVQSGRDSAGGNSRADYRGGAECAQGWLAFQTGLPRTASRSRREGERRPGESFGELADGKNFRHIVVCIF